MANHVREVKLEREVYKKLGMRSSAEELFSKFSDDDSNIIMDFDNVEFMSRSFAQEYVYQKHKTKANIEERNMSGSVKDMYNIVSKDFNDHLQK